MISWRVFGWSDHFYIRVQFIWILMWLRWWITIVYWWSWYRITIPYRWTLCRRITLSHRLAPCSITIACRWIKCRFRIMMPYRLAPCLVTSVDRCSWCRMILGYRWAISRITSTYWRTRWYLMIIMFPIMNDAFSSWRIWYTTNRTLSTRSISNHNQVMWVAMIIIDIN